MTSLEDDIRQVSVLRRRGDLDGAARMARDLLGRCGGAVGHTVEVLRQYGLVLRAQSELTAALEAHAMALELADSTVSTQTIARLHVHRAVTYMRLVDLDAADLALRLARLAWTDLDQDTQFQVLSNEARLLRARGDTVRAHERSMVARSIAESSSDVDALGRAHVELARSYASVGATEEALEEAFAAVRCSDPERHAQTLISAYTTIYVAYHTLRRYQDALDYARRAYDVAMEFGAPHERLNAGFNVALATTDVGQLAEGFALLRSMRRAVKQLKDETVDADYLHTLGQLHLMREDHPRAQRVMSSCVAIYARTRPTERYQSARFMLAQAYRGLGQLDTASEIAEGIIGFYGATEQRYDSLLASVLDFVASVEYDRGRAQQAYEHLRQLMALRSRSHAELAQRLASVLDLRYRVEQMQRHSQRIEAENADMRAQLASAALRLVQHASAQRRAPSVINAEWRLFQMQFDRVHVGVIRSLSATHPSLTAAELRVCTMLIAAFATKDIAAVLSCSTRTVEWHRANIRRKLRLKPNANLTTYLARFVAA